MTSTFSNLFSFGRKETLPQQQPYLHNQITTSAGSTGNQIITPVTIGYGLINTDHSIFGMNAFLNNGNTGDLFAIILVRSWESNGKHLAAKQGDIVMALDTRKFYRCTSGFKYLMNNYSNSTGYNTSNISNTISAEWEEIEIIDLSDKLGIQVLNPVNAEYISPAVNHNNEEVKELFDAFEKNLKIEPEKNHSFKEKFKSLFSPESKPATQTLT